MHKYVALARCGDRTCTECRLKDFYRLYNAYAPQITKLGKHGLKLVTMTQKNRESLEGCVEDLREAWKKLRRRTPYKDIWYGGLYAVEAVNKGRGWHVHLHVLVEGGYVSQRLLAADWQELTGDSCIVDIRDVVIREPSPQIWTFYFVKRETAPVQCGNASEGFGCHRGR